MYLNRFRTKRDVIAAIKVADANEVFFSRDTKKFFGSESYDMDGDVFLVYHPATTTGGPRTSRYGVDPVTLKLTYGNLVSTTKGK